MATTYNNLYLDTRKRLRSHGVEMAQLEARELVCFAADKTREQFFRDLTLYASKEVEERVEELTRRRLAGEPVAYIIGEWEFYGLPLDISRDVLIPRMDTEVLAERGILKARESGEGARVLDLCAGSGCVGLAVAANAPQCRVLLGELSEGAVRICRQNIRRNQLSGQVSVMVMDAMAKPPAAIGEFDCIVCNPPYIPRAEIETLDISVKNFEPYQALCGGEDGYDFYSYISQHWRGALRSGGRLYFEVGIGQADTVLRMMRANGFGDINVVQDTRGIPRVVYGTRLEAV